MMPELIRIIQDKKTGKKDITQILRSLNIEHDELFERIMDDDLYLERIKPLFSLMIDHLYPFIKDDDTFKLVCDFDRVKLDEIDKLKPYYKGSSSPFDFDLIAPPFKTRQEIEVYIIGITYEMAKSNRKLSSQ